MLSEALGISSVFDILPIFGDLDADGDLDSVQLNRSGGSRDGDILEFYKNTSTGGAAKFVEQDAQTGLVPKEPNPYHFEQPNLEDFNLVDMDADGDLDLQITGFDYVYASKMESFKPIEGFYYYENIAPAGQSPVFTTHRAQDNLLDSLPDAEVRAKLHLYDIDQDGDFDLLLQEGSSLSYYPNTGNAQQAVFALPAQQFDMGDNPLQLIDVDQDNDMDLVQCLREVKSLYEFQYIDYYIKYKNHYIFMVF